MLLYKLAGTTAAVLCVALLTVGIVVDSSPFRAQLNSGFSPSTLIAVMLTYTPSNVALLAMLSGFIGGSSSLITHHVVLKKEGAHVDQSVLHRI